MVQLNHRLTDEVRAKMDPIETLELDNTNINECGPHCKSRQAPCNVKRPRGWRPAIASAAITARSQPCKVL
jgi:hypothetical protein